MRYVTSFVMSITVHYPRSCDMGYKVNDASAPCIDSPMNPLPNPSLRWKCIKISNFRLFSFSG